MRKFLIQTIVIGLAVFTLTSLALSQDAGVSENPLTVAQAWGLFAEAKHQEALEAFENILKDNSGLMEARLGKAKCLLYLNQLTASEELYAQLATEDPHNIAVWIGLGRSYDWQGKYKEAEEAYKKVLAIDPQNLEVKNDLANVYRYQGESQKAQLVYQDILSVDPRNQDALQGLKNVETAAASTPLHSAFFQYLAEKDAGGFTSKSMAYGYRYAKPLDSKSTFSAEYRMEDFDEDGKDSALGEIVEIGGQTLLTKDIVAGASADLRHYSSGTDFFAGGKLFARWQYFQKNSIEVFYGHQLFDVLDNVREHQYGAEVKTYLGSRVTLSNFYQAGNLSDDNRRHTWFHNLSFQVFPSNPEVVYSIGLRDRDFKDVSSNYYSPQDLETVVHSLYLGTRISGAYVYTIYKYLDNNDDVDNSYYLLGAEWNVKKNLSAGFEASYFGTNTKYQAAGGNIVIRWKF